jgi:hypothetical protein
VGLVEFFGEEGGTDSSRYVGGIVGDFVLYEIGLENGRLYMK